MLSLALHIKVIQAKPVLSLLLCSSLLQSSTVDLKTKEEKDAELDKRIEALRKKNEALMKRYQVWKDFTR